MSVDITDLIKLRNDIDNLREEASAKNNLANTWEASLRAKCAHPTTKTDRHYSPGGYDYVSSVTINVYCTICGKSLKTYDDPKHKGYHG